MIGSPVVDTVIGLILIFLLLAIAASAFNEVAEGLLKRRSKYLRRTIERITDEDVAGQLYATKWIGSLSDYAHSLRAPNGLKQQKMPSYIPSEVFARAVTELLERTVAEAADAAAEAIQRIGLGDDLAEIVDALPDDLAVTVLGRLGVDRSADLDGLANGRELLDSVLRDLPGTVSDRVVALFPGGVLDQLDNGADALRHWYDDVMDRMSGWYGRQTKWLLLVWGILLAVVLNVDTFAVSRTLWSDDAAREAAVAAAEAAVAGGQTDCVPGEEDPYECVDAAIEEIRSAETLGLPLGWPAPPWNWGDYNDGDDPDAPVDPRIPTGLATGLVKLIGMLVTGGAVAMGAPFWFDLLNKFVNFRAAGPKPASTATSREA